ncbi:hypothetical protein [Psychromonas sp. SP041]|uniref:hypothetical protein n=1 Tax=Psychromonas sp. SP041 TaxID=1365007 RepID=UPI0010C7A223|nr:hypothetical protein [Psychromonas sp. SP041]
MRRRYQLNLQTESELESELSDYLERHPQGSKRSEEIRRFCLIGFQMMIKGKTEEESVINSYDPGLQRVISNYAKSEQKRNQDSSQISELINLLKNKGKSQEEILLEQLLSGKSNDSDIVSSLAQMLSGTDSSKDLKTCDSPPPNENKAPSRSIETTIDEHEKAEVPNDETNVAGSSSTLTKRYTPSVNAINEEVNASIPEIEDVDILSDEPPLDFLLEDEENSDIEDPLARLGF